MTNVSYVDQTELFNPANWIETVHVIGVGGIGSAVALLLVKLGVDNLHLWDDDMVEAKNVPGQVLYGASDVGRPKVLAAQEALERFGTEVEVTVHRERVTSKTELQGIVIVCVDSIDSRKEIWGALKNNIQVPLMMDGRVGSLICQLFSYDPSNPEHVEAYAKTLFDGQEAWSLLCSARAIIHAPTQVAVWVTKNLTLFAQGELPPKFLTENLG